MLRSIASIIVGYIVISVTISTATYVFTQMVAPEAAVPAGTLVPPTVIEVIFRFVISFLASIAGGYVAARIAIRNERMHSIALGIVLFLLNIIVLLTSPEIASFWLGLLSAILFLPGTYIGGYLYALRVEGDQQRMGTNI